MMKRVPDHLVPTEAKIALLTSWALVLYDDDDRFTQSRQVGRWVGLYHLDEDEEGKAFITEAQFFSFESEEEARTTFEGLMEPEHAA